MLKKRSRLLANAAQGHRTVEMQGNSALPTPTPLVMRKVKGSVNRCQIMPLAVVIPLTIVLLGKNAASAMRPAIQEKVAA